MLWTRDGALVRMGPPLSKHGGFTRTPCQIDYLTAPQSQQEAKMLQGQRESGEAWALKGSRCRFKQSLAWECTAIPDLPGEAPYKPQVRTRL